MHCGGILTAGRQKEDAVQRAREILDRWQATDILEQLQSPEKIPAFSWNPRRTLTDTDAVTQGARPDAADTRLRIPAASDSRTASESEIRIRAADKAGDTTLSAPCPQEDPLAADGLHAGEAADAPETGKVTGEPEASTEPSFEPAAKDRVEESPPADRGSTPVGSDSGSTPPLPPHRISPPMRSASPHSTGNTAVSRKLRIDLLARAAAASEEAEAAAGESADLEATAAPGASSASDEEAPAAAVSNADAARPARRLRIDSPQSLQDLTETDDARTRSHGRPATRYLDEPHSAYPPGPHFQVNSPRRSNLTSLTGQFLAYIGVLGLTIGTAIVIYGHFGGYADYTPTGWLVTTVAQMLLFLGVINLVSGGIEQNNDDVSRRINSLGEQLQRIELVTEEALRGPRIPAHRYLEGERDQAETKVQTARVPRA